MANLVDFLVTDPALPDCRACNYDYQLVTPPTQNPVSLDEIKMQLNITGTQDDVYLRSLNTAATKWVEKYINEVLVTQTWALFLDCWPNSNEIVIKKRPLQSVTNVNYYPADWNKSDPRSTYAATNYTVTEATQGKDALIFRFADASWPDLFQIRQAVRIEFIAGQEPADICADIKQAIAMIVTFLYENRGDCIDESTLPGAIFGILNLNKVYNVGC